MSESPWTQTECEFHCFHHYIEIILLTVTLRVVLMNYREDGTTPFVTVWKHGLKAEKV